MRAPSPLVGGGAHSRFRRLAQRGAGSVAADVWPHPPRRLPSPYNPLVIRNLITWELLILGAFVLIVGAELVKLLIARRRGLTKNVSRVVTFSSLLVLAGAYALLELRWLSYDEAAGSLEALRQLPTANWGYLVLGVMIALVLAYEVASLVHARLSGLTTAAFRLAALLVAVVLLLVLLGISQVKWDLYLGGLEAAYSESVQPDSS